MQKLNILNTREIKEIKERLLEQFGYTLQEDYAYLQTNDYRIFLVSKDLVKINIDHLIIDRTGLYFAEIMKSREVRLSKEGAQLLAEEAKKNKKELKNTINLSEEEVRLYFQGRDLDKDLGSEKRLVLLYKDKDLLGCAKYKEGKILNFLPKINRGEVIL